MSVENRQLVAKLCVFVAGSFAFGFALVPLYRVLCQVTGYGDQQSLRKAVSLPGTSAGASAGTGAGSADTARIVTVEFLTTLPTVGNWEFRASQASLQVHPGRLYEASFVARNLTGHDTVAQAIPNIAPSEAATWFHKTQCFCFSPQAFKAGEQRTLPVRFFVDRSMPTYLDHVTLSYSFFDTSHRVASR